MTFGNTGRERGGSSVCGRVAGVVTPLSIVLVLLCCAVASPCHYTMEDTGLSFFLFCFYQSFSYSLYRFLLLSHCNDYLVRFVSLTYFFPCAVMNSETVHELFC